MAVEYPASKKRFISSKFLLPLFVNSRNQKKKDRSSGVRPKTDQQLNAPDFRSGDEAEENDFEELTVAVRHKFAHAHHLKKNPCATSKKKKDSWKLAPNRYDVTGEPGLSRKGNKGAFWSKLRRGDKRARVGSAIGFYEIGRDITTFQKGCHQHKGRFLTDPRRRRPTSRFMVNDMVTCWRNPKDPDPAKYFITQEECRKKSKHPPVPFKFLRYTCVPEKKNVAHGTKTSFDPCPGRYDLMGREEFIRIDLEIEMRKILKFRRLPYKHIPVRKPKVHSIWQHIYGYGFKRLFRGKPLQSLVVVTQRKARKMEREVKLYASFQYIQMIAHPDRNPLWERSEKRLKQHKPLRYNSIVRVIIRRQLRNNKKIAFNSGMPRFVEESGLIAARVTEKPPPLVDHPVMRVPVSEIKSKLFALPKRLMGISNENRSRPFKFQPFPPVKLLLNEKELQPAGTEIHPSDLNPVEFFKDEFRRH